METRERRRANGKADTVRRPTSSWTSRRPAISPIGRWTLLVQAGCTESLAENSVMVVSLSLVEVGTKVEIRMANIRTIHTAHTCASAALSLPVFHRIALWLMLESGGLDGEKEFSEGGEGQERPQGTSREKAANGHH